jgi:cation diffusion facilitator family transporter
MHVLADAMTSVLAIVALLAAKFYGLVWMDPAVGFIGAVVIASWSYNLIRSSTLVLLDEVANPRLAGRLRKQLEIGGDRVADLHLWRLGPDHTGLIVSIVTEDPRDPDVYRTRIADVEGLSHVTIEVHRSS